MSLSAIVTSTPKGHAKGRYACEITPDGLTLIQGKEPPILLKRGCGAEDNGKGQLSVQHEGHELQIKIASAFKYYQHRLARDLAEFLRGDRPAVSLSDYVLPWYLYLFVVLPVGIPILTLGGAIPGALGFGLAGACFGIVQNDTWSLPARIVAALGVTALGYLLVFGLLFAAAANQ